MIPWVRSSLTIPNDALSSVMMRSISSGRAKALKAVVPNLHRSDRLGHANTAQGDKAGIVIGDNVAQVLRD